MKKISKRFENLFVVGDLDKTLAIAGIVSSLILLVYLNRTFNSEVYALTGILTLTSCVLWLIIRKNHTFDFHLPESYSRTTIWNICFFTLYTLSILSIYLRPNYYERPLIYFLLIALMASVLACGSLSSTRSHAYLIIIQIIMLGLNIAWSQLLIFPDLIGFDPGYHRALTYEILDAGSIPTEYVYSGRPLFHIIIALTSLTTDFPYKFATMLSVGLVQIICNAIFIFITSSNLFKNFKIGLLASLLVIIADNHIFMSFISIPNSFAAVFIPIIIYLLLIKLNGATDSIFIGLSLFLMISIILIHDLTAVCIVLLLFVAWRTFTISRIFYLDDMKRHFKLLVPISFAVIMITWWAYSSNSLLTLAQLLEQGFSARFFDKTPIELKEIITSTYPSGEMIFNNAGMFLFFALSFIGIFFMISKKGNTSTLTMALTSLTPLAVGFFSLILGYSLVGHRWWYFAQILMSIPLAVSIYIITSWKLKQTRSRNTFLFIFIAILSILNIMSPAANIDNSIFSPNTSMRSALTEAELSATTILEKYEDTPKTDFYYATRLNYLGDYNVDRFCPEVSQRHFSDLQDNLILIRKEIIDDVFLLYNSYYKSNFNIKTTLEQSNFSMIYDNGSLYAFIGEHEHH